MVYAALVEGLSPDERDRLDNELALPLGETSESKQAQRQEWMALHGWKM